MNHKENCRYAVEKILEKCWHDDNWSPAGWYCQKCGIGDGELKDNPPKPTFTDANSIKLLTDKMNVKNIILAPFLRFLEDRFACTNSSVWIYWILHKPQDQLALIVEFYKQQEGS